MARKKYKIKWKNVFILFTFIILLNIIIYSSIEIIKWKLDGNKIDEEIQNIEDLAKIEEVTDNENTEIIEQDNIDETNYYWDYIKMSLINVDFEELKKINDETKGWIQVNGTNINYPFVQTNNNDYYLSHSFEKKYNSAGWVFLDFRNKLDGSDKNTILYAHGRLDSTMFGSLKNILSSGWLNNKNNYIVKLSTEYENTSWQVFSVYHIPTTSDYIQTQFSSDDEYLEFLNIIKNRSFYDFNTNVQASDRILTLSTCYNSSEKVVLHAKLIKRETR